MKVFLKNFLTAFLSVAFVVSTFMCCCFIPEIEAQEKVMSCHYAETTTDEPDKSTQECDCETSFNVLTKQSFDLVVQVQVIALNVTQSIFHSFDINAWQLAYQAPPSVIPNTIPIYLQNSSFRI